ncbi:phosphoribosyltransferase [Alsobacter sp. R-9]
MREVIDMFADRRDAGRRLGRALSDFKKDNPIIYGLPRGGVPVAAEIAKVLGAPLDVLMVRKIGAPGQPELALGAVADGCDPTVFWNQKLVAAFGLLPSQLDQLSQRQKKIMEERSSLYRAHRPGLSPSNRVVIVVDDGLATGATMLAALRALHRQKPCRIIVAVPVAPAEMIEALREEADEVIVLDTPLSFRGVGGSYARFDQTEDSEVLSCLDELAAQARRVRPEMP